MFTIRTFGDQDNTKQDIRHGEILATIFSMILCLGVSIMTNSLFPLVSGVIVAGSMIAVYEWAMATAHG